MAGPVLSSSALSLTVTSLTCSLCSFPTASLLRPQQMLASFLLCCLSPMHLSLSHFERPGVRSQAGSCVSTCIAEQRLSGQSPSGVFALPVHLQPALCQCPNPVSRALPILDLTQKRPRGLQGPILKTALLVTALLPSFGFPSLATSPHTLSACSVHLWSVMCLISTSAAGSPPQRTVSLASKSRV